MTQDRAFFDQSVTSSGSAILPQWVMMDVYSRVRLPSLYRRACEQAAGTCQLSRARGSGS